MPTTTKKDPKRRAPSPNEMRKQDMSVRKMSKRPVMDSSPKEPNDLEGSLRRSKRTRISANLIPIYILEDIMGFKGEPVRVKTLVSSREKQDFLRVLPENTNKNPKKEIVIIRLETTQP